MKDIYSELANRFQEEIRDLDRVVMRASRIWEQAKLPGVEQDVYLDSVALNLHSLYSGVERLFELVARHLDGSLPSSQTWHRDLLQIVGHDVPGVRPAVIGADTADMLDEFRRFRHLVRNVYTTNLAPEKMVGLFQTLPVLWPQLKSELLAFARFLGQLAYADERT